RGHARDVGGDEADEGEHAGERRGRADEKADGEDGVEAQAPEVDAERGGGVGAEVERVEVAPQPEGESEAGAARGQRPQKVRPRAALEAAHEPVDDLEAEVPLVRGERLAHGDERSAQRAESDAGEQEDGEAGPAAGGG